MSQEIYSSRFYDPNVDQVRQVAEQMDDRFPFLLMPVRLETRFMQVDRPIQGYENTVDIEILSMIQELRYLFERIQLAGEIEQIDIQAIQERIVEIMDILGGLTDDPWTLPYPENEWWLDHREQILDIYANLDRVYDKLPAELQDEFSGLADTLTNTVAELNTYEVTKAKPQDHAVAKTLINKLNRVEEVFDQIIDKPGDYTPKSKHTYFNFLENRTDTIRQVCEDVEEMAKGNILANTTQINRIKEFTEVYNSKLQETRNVFSNIQSAYKRNEFLQKHENELSPGLAHFTSVIEEVITPKLEYIRKLKTVKASEMIYKAEEIRFELQNINLKGLSNYREVKKTRTHLYGLLRGFRAMSHNIITGPQWQIDKLKSTWSEVDQLLESFTGIVQQVPVSGRYRRGGITRTISHINENYRADLAGLKPEAASTSLVLGNSNFAESAHAYTISLKKMEEITARFKALSEAKAPAPAEFIQAAQKLKEFSAEFASLSAKTTIIPEDYFKAIHGAHEDLNQAVSIVVASMGEDEILQQPAADMNAAIHVVKDDMTHLASDITDEADPFYDDFRKEIICADLTQTVDELWVRIYPDEVLVNTHEKAVTHDESDDTRYFWTEVWNCMGDKETELAAWRALAVKYGINRAIYLRQLFNPDPDGTMTKPVRAIILVKQKFNSLHTFIDGVVKADRNDISDFLLRIQSFSTDLTNAFSQVDQLQAESATLIRQVFDLAKALVHQLMPVPGRLQETILTGASSLPAAEQEIAACIEKLGNMAVRLSALKPVNDITLLPGIVTPSFPTGIELKDAPWSQAPRSEIMPDRFVFIGIVDGQFTHMKVGNAIPDPLVVGINPATMDTGSFEYDEFGNLHLDEDSKWMTDFESAVDKGMAMTIPLTSAEKAAGFDKIIVIGIRGNGAEAAKLELEDLLEAHSYTEDGIGILPIGTPTNNTDKKASGFTSEEDTEKAYERITGDPLFDTTDADKDDIDGYRLKKALGIREDLFDRLELADGKDIYKALLMNRSMWYATMGYYMEEVMDTLFNLDNIKRTKYFFNHYVSGRGWLPSLRIGTQPYGILPTTAFSRFRAYPNETMPGLTNADFGFLSDSQLDHIQQKRFDIRLYKLFQDLNFEWGRIVANQRLQLEDFVPGETSAQEHFMKLLGLQATSIEQYFRYNTNTAQRRASDADIGSNVNFSAEQHYGPHHLRSQFGNFSGQGVYIDDTYYDMKKIDRFSEARIFRLRYFDEFRQLTGPFVRVDDDEILKKVGGDTYIDKLFSTPLQYFWTPEVFGNIYNPSLFFMFLRQSLALAYRDVGLDILIKEEIINENTRRRAGTKGTYLLPGPDRKDIIFDKWDYLFMRQSELENMMREENAVFKKFPIAGDWSTNDFWKDIAGQGWTLADFLYNKLSSHPDTQGYTQQDISKLHELRDNFMELKELPVSELERLFAEHLDLCTYRFDAWQLGLANKRLNVMRTRSNGSEGIYLGAVGWLEDLTPGGDRTATSNLPDQLKEYDNKLVYTDADNEGFIHSPSLNHALTAAILRSGYIANEVSGDLNNPMAVNLTSRRVRMALKLVEGIQKGQDTGALLGYQFERGLHENYLDHNLELDKYIYTLRRAFPLEDDADDNVTGNNDKRKTMNVVSGLKLLEAIRDELGEGLMYADTLFGLAIQHSNALRQRMGLPLSIQPDELRAILKEVDNMANAFDALGDLLISESVYHIAQGNHVRSGAVFAALAEGRVPPEVQIIHTPRTGHVLTQRVILQLDSIARDDVLNNPNAVKPQYWQDIPLTPRSKAEPAVNRWLGAMIGDPDLIRCYVTYQQNGVEEYYLVKLSDLSMQPIDVVYTLGSHGDDAGFEMNKWIAYHVRFALDLPADTLLDISFTKRDDHLLEDSESLIPDIKTFHEVMPLMSGLFQVISKSRFTTAEDYVVPGENIPPDQNLHRLNVSELNTRITDVISAYDLLLINMRSVYATKGISHQDLNAVRDAYWSPAEINSLRGFLYDSARYGLPDTIPDKVTETDNDAGREIALKAANTITAIEKLMEQAAPLHALPEELDDKVKVDKLSEAAKILLGKSFTIVPQFDLRNKQELGDILAVPADQGIMRNAPEFAMESWVEGLSKVRTKINRLEMVNTMSTMFETGFPDYQPIQLPFDTVEHDSGESVADYWMGLEYPEGYEPENDKLSLVLLNEEKLYTASPNAPCCGLLVDEWIEVIPEKEETTGITFHYDQPDAEPPQSMLLAVPPVETGKWKWDDLVYTVLDTMDLYKARLVEPEHIDKSVFTQVLPAVLGEYPAPNEYRVRALANLGLYDLAENNIESTD